MTFPAALGASAGPRLPDRSDPLPLWAQVRADLRKRIEALQAREYRAPKMDMMCKEQRQAVLLCYQTMRGAPAGEKVFKCQEAVDDLDRCATLVREAALSKIAQS